MKGNITQEPLARAVLAKLARTRGVNDPLGSLARAALDGEAELRTAATMSWHGAGLQASFEEAMARRGAMTQDELAEHSRQTQLLLSATDLAVLDEDDDPRPEGGQQ